MSSASTGAIDATRQWIESMVIGLHLCPFAAAPFNGERIRYQLSEAESVEAIYQDFLSLLYELFTSDPADVETALLILEHGLTDFAAYLDAIGLLDAVVAEAGAEGLVQIAGFHPDYRFDGAEPDDPANYTNRSPYPMFHLIREDGLAAALESVDDPQAIPTRNVERLRALGIEGIRKRLEHLGGR